MMQLPGIVRRNAGYAVALSTAIVYATFPTRTYYWDGVLFSLNVEQVHAGNLPADVLFHPNHLVYSAFGYVLYALMASIGLSIRAITVFQACNIVLSAFGSAVLYRLARDLTRSGCVAVFCWLLFAFGATWWKFSTDANSYVISVFLLLLSFREVSTVQPRLLVAGACHTLAMLFHELAVFAYVPMVAAIAWQTTRSRKERGVRAAIYVAATAGSVAAAYLACYASADHRMYPNLFAWITSYASDSGFTKSLGQIAGSYLGSYLKLFFGGKVSLVRQFLSPTVVAALLGCMCCTILAVVGFLRPKQERLRSGVERRTVSLLWLWFVPAAVFLACWDPGSAFHKLFVWPPIVLLIGVLAASGTSIRHNTWIALALAVMMWNFGAFIFPHTHSSADPVLTVAQRIDREMPKNAVVYYEAFSPDDWYLDYFAPGRNWAELPATREGILNEHANGAVVCLETTALNMFEADAGLRERLERAIDPNRRWDLVNLQHNVRLECLR